MTPAPPPAPTASASAPSGPPLDAAGADLIGAHWPQSESLTPVRTHRIHWLLAFPAAFLALLAPRRLGPHLAASSWLAAWVVHWLALLYAVGGAFVELTHTAVASQFEYAHFNRGFWEPLLGPPAAIGLLALWLFDSWWHVGLTLAVLATVHAVFWVLGWLITPLISVGERPRAALFRSVKLVQWSTVAIVPLTHVFLAAGLLPYLAYGFLPGGFLNLGKSTFVVALGLAWWFTLIVRLGGRYGGAPVGPRWDPRTPRCEDCGYTLTGLAPDRRCPECGRPVRDSLPEHRQLPPIARARNPLLWPIAFVHTAWLVILNPRFAQTTSLWRGQRAAMNYALMLCLFAGLIVGLVGRYWLIDWYWGATAPAALILTPNGGFEERSLLHWRWIYAGGAAAVTTLLAAGWMWLLALLVSGFGLRDAAGRRVLICYAQSWTLLVVLLLTAGSLACLWLSRQKFPVRVFHVFRDVTIDSESLLFNLFLMPAWVVALLMVLALQRMFRQSRYAAG